MIDDHPSMIEGYKSILSFNDLGLRITTTPAYNCESAYNIIDTTPITEAFDFAFVDLSLPPYLEKNIKSGEDLALLIKNKFPKCKIVILTSHAEAFILDNIQRNIAPNGLLVKSDFTADEFLLAFEKIYNNHIYTSKTVIENIAELHEKNSFLDEFVKTYYSDFPKTKVAILTSSIDPKDEERATEYTIAIDFLSKPLTAKMLNELKTIFESEQK